MCCLLLPLRVQKDEDIFRAVMDNGKPDFSRFTWDNISDAAKVRTSGQALGSLLHWWQRKWMLAAGLHQCRSAAICDNPSFQCTSRSVKSVTTAHNTLFHG